ncbi:MAG: hypothetical protein HZA54_20900 [Planctomycetes bacterium]|nr:hypothetical protein [Planctomycetota bacterium]
MNLVQPQASTNPPAIDSFAELRAFVVRFRAEIKAGDLDTLRPHLARLAPHYQNLAAGLKRVQARTGRTDVTFSPLVEKLAPLFAERKEGWLNQFLRAAAAL